MIRDVDLRVSRSLWKDDSRIGADGYNIRGLNNK